MSQLGDENNMGHNVAFSPLGKAPEVKYLQSVEDASLEVTLRSVCHPIQAYMFLVVKLK